MKFVIRGLLLLALGFVFFPLSKLSFFTYLDQSINTYLLPINPSNSLISSVLRDVSDLGHIYIALPIINILLFLALWIYKHKLEALLLVLVNISIPIGILLKLVFNTTRPSDLNSPALLESFLNGSYPSLHTLYYTVFWGFLVYVTFFSENKKTKAHQIPTFLNMTLRWLGILFILTIGISRVYSNEHWVTDVVGGYIFGYALVYFFIAIHVFLEQELKKKQELQQ